MDTPNTSLTAAIHVYALTMAYLQDALIGNDGPVKPVRAEEIAPNYFYIWHLENSYEPRWFDTLAAACTYNEAAQTWIVHLLSGESLRLHDKDNIWQLAKSEVPKCKQILHTTD